MLPAFASIDELALRIPGGVSDDDSARAQAALDDASALIRSEAGKNWTVTDDDDVVSLDDVPDVIVSITCRAAQRSFVNPSGLSQDTTGPFSASYANASSDVYLTANEKNMVRRAAGRNLLTTRSTTRGPLETGCVSGAWGVADEYAEVSPPGEPIPFL